MQVEDGSALEQLQLLNLCRSGSDCGGNRSHRRGRVEPLITARPVATQNHHHFCFRLF